MPATTSSNGSPSSKRNARGAAGTRKGRGALPVRSVVPALAIALVLAALSASAIAFFYLRGYLLYYGDAVSHINIARRIVDSRTPGLGQIGTVWLPLPHLLMLPLVWDKHLWMTGLAGAIPAGICFVIAGLFVFLATRRVFNDGAAAVAATLMMTLNPNLLYLASIPMTEPVFLACLAALLYFTVRFRETQGRGALVGAALAAAAGSLARYEGWFVIPFAALYFLIAARGKRRAAVLTFSIIASLGPLAWLAHNLFYYGNAFEFYNGAASAKAIYQHALDAGMTKYPGDHDWRKAAEYLAAAIRLCVAWPLVILGAAGAAIALARRALWPLLLLSLVPVFYLWSLHSGSTPVFVPHLWPNSFYNTRYGLSALPLVAFAAAALVTIAPAGLRKQAAVIVVLLSVCPWLAYPRPEAWICWKESQVNSEARRDWTHQAAEYMRANYHRGDGILTPVGDVSGIYQEVGIPLAETFNECNWPAWERMANSPNPAPSEKWAVAISGDKVADLVMRAGRPGPRYDLLKTISVKGAPVIEIYHRQP